MGFIVLLFLAYYYLPGNVAVHYNDAGRPDSFVAKSAFFYTCGIFVIVFYVAVSLLARLIISVPAKLFPMPNRTYWLRDTENQEEFHEILRDWLNSLIVIIMVWASFCLYALFQLNTSDNADVLDYRWVFVMGVVALVIWILFLPVRLMVRKNSLLD